MQDRFQPNFDQRRQSEAAKIADFEAFRAAINLVDGGVGLEPASGLEKRSDSLKKPVLAKIPRKLRYPVLAATAGAALIGSACGVNKTETPQATYEGQVLGVNVTPVPSVSGESGLPKPAELTPQVEQSKKAPDFTLKDTSGNPVSLHDFAGRSLIIEYAQSNCPPCNFESTKLGEIKKKYIGQGLTVLNISTSIDANFSRDVPVLLDPDSKFAEAYTIVAGVPATIFIDRSGNEVFRYPGYSREKNDLDLLADAFMAGRDMENVFPTPTPAPTVTPLPTRAPESENRQEGEAVFDLGNFALGITGWEDLTNVPPYKIGVGGKQVDIKTVVVKAIFRSKADKVMNLIDSAEESLGNISFVDSSGKDIEYLPGSGRVNVHLDEPLKYGGAINEPFVQTLNGDFVSTGTLCKSKKYTLDRFTPGFGIPVSIIATVPINVRDYGIAILEPGRSQKKIVMNGKATTDFKTIAEDVPIHDQGYVFRLQGNNDEYVDSSLKGFQKAQYSHGFPPDILAAFHFIDRLHDNPFYYFLLQGNLFLKDGRVLQIELAEGSLNFGQEGDLQGNVGGKIPENKCPLINHNTLQNAYGFDLKDSIAVLNFGFQSVAWRVQDNAGR